MEVIQWHLSLFISDSVMHLFVWLCDCVYVRKDPLGLPACFKKVPVCSVYILLNHCIGGLMPRTQGVVYHLQLTRLTGSKVHENDSFDLGLNRRFSLIKFVQDSTEDLRWQVHKRKQGVCRSSKWADCDVSDWRKISIWITLSTVWLAIQISHVSCFCTIPATLKTALL